MFIYGLYDPSIEPRVIRYVGYTANTLKRRLIEHVAEARKCRCHRHEWLLSVRAKGLKPAIVLLESVTAENCRERECFWIAALAGPHLINSTAGGEGLINPSADVRERISKAVSAKLIGNQYRKGVPHDDASKRAIAEGMKASIKFRASMESRRGKPGHPQTEEARDKVRRSKLGKKRPPFSSEWIEKIRLASTGKKHSAETIAKRAASLIGNQRAKGNVMTAEAKRKIAVAKLQTRWITNGIEEMQIKPGVFIPRGWKLGRL